MNFRQKVFIVIALISLLQVILNFTNYATSVIPGWHVPNELNIPIWGTFSYFIFFILLALVYKYVPRQHIKGWYFWIHALFSILPIVFMSVYNWFFWDGASHMSLNRFEENQMVNKLADWIFFLNQVVFLLLLLFKQMKNPVKLHPTTTAIS
ncbi:hypothetical protein [Botryobacter ruber]|uniref:hypothetical protein n=1 Tax=Botryobacter ruber TaxID=2171629 RepID=UPI000F64E2A2|nr:hypothetical protein [Botryobacter ruber]